MSRLLSLRIAILLAFVAALAAAQIEEQDLELEAPSVPPEIVQLYQEALAKFSTTEQPDTIRLFTQVIEALEPMALSGVPEVEELYRDSLAHRAMANFNLGDTAAVEADLSRLLQLDPAFDIDRENAVRKYVQLFDRLREQTVGTVELAITPEDATLTIAGKPIAHASGAIPLIAGEYTALIERPGYESATMTIPVEAGAATPVEIELERTSAVITLRTRPAEVSVFVDGALRAETSGSAVQTFVPSGAAARYPAHEFSERLSLDGIPLGTHEVQLRKPGFRPVGRTVVVDRLDDYDLGAIVLERETGTVLLTQLPSDARVHLDGRRAQPVVDQAGDARLELSPGTYRLAVTRGTTERFEELVDVADQQTARIVVRLRPAVVLLGVLGGDRRAASELQERLNRALEALGAWSLIDRAEPIAGALGALGLEPGVLRSLATGAGTREIDWQAVQSRIAREAPGAVYVLGVLDDDLLARAADLWIWPAPPGPSRPERRRVSLEGDDLSTLAHGFSPDYLRPRPALGAIVVDSFAGEGPVVASVSGNSAAARAGLAVGDEILSFAGSPTFDAGQFDQQLLKLEAGETTTIEVRRRGRPETIEVALDRSWILLELNNPALVYPALAAVVDSELARASDWPRWVLLANRAILQLVAGDPEAAVRTLREIDPSTVPASGSRIGAPTLDYLVALALQQAGPRYFDLAEERFARAAGDAEARLEHADGPLVEPRARIRSRALRLGTQP